MKELARLRADYAKSLSAKLRTLGESISRARHDPDQPDVMADAVLLAHRLRGTAGSYGFVEVGEAAGRIEDLLKDAGGLDGNAGLWNALDMALLEAMAHASTSAIADPPPTTSPSAVSTRVLVVDDDPEILEFVEKVGQKLLVEITTARTPAEALEQARRAVPHLALVDVWLGPEGASFELATELKTLPGCEALPLAFMSVDGGVDSRVAAAHAGASLFLSKPIDAGMIDTTIRQLLAARQSEMPRILVVDDDPDFIDHVSSCLDRVGMRVNGLADPLMVLRALENSNPDLLLLDATMPGINGFDVCRMLRATPRWQYLPIIFVTADARRESRMAAFGAGGDDYLTKPVLEEELLSRIRVRVDRARLLRERSDTDSLTGLLLRRSFLEQMAIRISESQRHELPLSVCLLDIDRFKKINDTHGHLSGDQVLIGLGKLLKGRFRAEDLRGRWGGEEFVIAFPREKATTVQRVMDRVLEEFRSIPFRSAGGERFTCTFSSGIASFPGDGRDIEALLRTADRRLYHAKQSGRARAVISIPDEQPAPV